MPGMWTQTASRTPSNWWQLGADVEALYPNLADLEVANICYDAVMKSKSKITFTNINYRKAHLYIASMQKTDQNIPTVEGSAEKDKQGWGEARDNIISRK